MQWFANRATHLPEKKGDTPSGDVRTRVSSSPDVRVGHRLARTVTVPGATWRSASSPSSRRARRGPRGPSARFVQGGSRTCRTTSGSCLCSPAPPLPCRAGLWTRYRVSERDHCLRVRLNCRTLGSVPAAMTRYSVPSLRPSGHSPTASGCGSFGSTKLGSTYASCHSPVVSAADPVFITCLGRRGYGRVVRASGVRGLVRPSPHLRSETSRICGAVLIGHERVVVRWAPPRGTSSRIKTQPVTTALPRSPCLPHPSLRRTKVYIGPVLHFKVCKAIFES